MVIDYIIAVLDVDIPDAPPANVTLLQEYNDGVAKSGFLHALDEVIDPLTLWPGSAYIVGAWWTDGQDGLQFGQEIVYDDNGEPIGIIGTPTYPLTADISLILPLGNKDRKATQAIILPLFQGHAWEKKQKDDELYPDSDRPMLLQIQRDDHTIPDIWSSLITYPANALVMHVDQGWKSEIDDNTTEPGQPGAKWEAIDSGWGMTITVVAEDPQRAAEDRIVKIFPDPECIPDTELFSTGTFTNPGGGDYTTTIPPGQWTLNPDQINWSLFDNVPDPDVQEGYANLPAGQMTAEANFWDHDQ